MNNQCPACKSKAVKAIYMGFPMSLCINEKCKNVFGFFSFLVEIYFNGVFLVYEGSYWQALKEWINGNKNID